MLVISCRDIIILLYNINHSWMSIILVPIHTFLNLKILFNMDTHGHHNDPTRKKNILKLVIRNLNATWAYYWYLYSNYPNVPVILKNLFLIDNCIYIQCINRPFPFLKVSTIEKNFNSQSYYYISTFYFFRCSECTDRRIKS